MLSVLDNVDASARLHGESHLTELQALSLELGRLQREIRAAGVPVVAVFEGWEAAGKGTAINQLMMALDPRGYRVHSVQPPSLEERLHPPLYRFWLSLPEAGRITIFDRSWYDRLLVDRVDGRTKQRHLEQIFAEITSFERSLVERGTLLIKFFLHISKREQAKRFKKLRKNPATKWRIDQRDLRQHRRYDAWAKAVDEAIVRTDLLNCPWKVIPAHDKRWVSLTVFRELRAALSARVDTPPLGSTPPTLGGAAGTERVSEGSNPLSEVDLGQTLARPRYEFLLGRLKKKLRDLEHRIYKNRIPVVIVCEGWDAAGKGGSIRRLVAGLDPRGYEVIPVAAPNDIERRHHYLWRFWTRMPKDGHIAIFDRSWYGRVLVERVEGFCARTEWIAAYEEISAMERSLVNHGTVLVKFWFHVDPEEQLRRFQRREQSPEKRWKITNEDWRNRERWKDYEAAVADAIRLTSNAEAPWTIVPANDKLFARVFAIRTVVQAIQDRLKRA